MAGKQSSKTPFGHCCNHLIRHDSWRAASDLIEDLTKQETTRRKAGGDIDFAVSSTFRGVAREHGADKLFRHGNLPVGCARVAAVVPVSASILPEPDRSWRHGLLVGINGDDV